MRLLLQSFPHVAMPGGVELLVSRLASTDPSRVFAGDLDALVREAGPDDVVFCQAEGMPDRDRVEAYRACLLAGAVVVEQNIFALPAPDRPLHDRFHMAFMSRDGFARYAVRCRLEGRRPRNEAVYLPNALLRDLDASRHVPDPAGTLRLLRMGRPDARKWTIFEVSLASAMARVAPDRRIRLTLVGWPFPVQDVPEVPPNLDVEVLPYTKDVEEQYLRADVYVHHSRIGETFGQTCVEAASAGCLVVAALDPRWDAAPLEFLDAAHVVRHPARLLDEPRATLDEIDARRLRMPRPPTADLSPTAFLDRIHSPRPDPVPTLREALEHLRAQSRTLGATAWEQNRSLFVEGLRASRRRVLATGRSGR